MYKKIFILFSIIFVFFLTSCEYEERDYYKEIDSYINYLIEESTPEYPLWNKEKILNNKETKWNYIDGCVTISLISLYDYTNESKYFNFVKDYIDYFIYDDGSLLGYKEKELDSISESRVLIDLYNYTKDDKYKKSIEYTYDKITKLDKTIEGSYYHKDIYPNQVWLDGLFMLLPFYTRYTYFNANNLDLDTKLEDIMTQYKNVRNNMFDEDKKLYYHGYDASKTIFWANKETGLSKNFWLRAMGWYLASISDVYSYMEDEDNKLYLKNLLKEAVDGILEYQDLETKLFYQVIDKKDYENNYLETSGSLLVAYSILKGVNIKALDESYKEIGLEIFENVCKYKLEVDEDNNEYKLKDICLSAGLGPENKPQRDGSIEYYLSEEVVSNDGKGIGPLIMAYTEALKLKENKL